MAVSTPLSVAASISEAGRASSTRAPRDRGVAECLHCGASLEAGQVDYCCPGCEHVHALLADEGLGRYYELRDGRGQPVREGAGRDEKWIDLVESDLKTRQGLSLVPLDVEGLHCTGCVWLISELFKRSGAAGSVVTNPARGSVDLWVAPEFPLREFVQTVGSFGYGLGPRRKKELASSDLVLRMGITIALAMNAMIFAISVYAGLETGLLHNLFHYLSFGLAMVALFVGGTVFIKGAFSAVRRGVLHLDLPIALGIVLGYAGSTYSLFATRGEQSYFDTLTVFIALMLVGRYLRERVLEKNRSQLLEEAGPLGLLVRRLGADGSAVEVVAVSEVRAGDRLLVAPGDVVPVSAKLHAARAVLSMDWITGEAEPLEITRGASIVAGAANAGREAFEVEASATFEASGLLDLLRVPRAVDRYGDASTPFEARLSRVWVILVMVAAAVGFAAWLASTGDVPRSLGVAIGILVVTCPCAFGIATPIAHEIVLGGLRRAGLLVRSASFLDRASSVRRVVFDKTGTLTTGALRLADARAAAALDAETQTILYNLASRSSHPKAEAMKLAVSVEARKYLAELRVTEHAGRGLSAVHAGAEYRLGSPRWVGAAEGSGDIAFGRDGTALFTTSTEEELRTDAADEVRRLADSGLEVWMLTGDKAEKADLVARTVCIPESHVVAECSPEGKANFLQGRDRQDTLMIGDGINDAMAVRAAHCSGTPGAGRTFLAARTDFYLLGAGLAPVRMALQGARSLRSAIRRNLMFAAAYNLGAVGLALAGLMTPLLCAVLMPLSSITSIALAVRALGGRTPAWKS